MKSTKYGKENRNRAGGMWKEIGEIKRNTNICRIKGKWKEMGIKGKGIFFEWNGTGTRTGNGAGSGSGFESGKVKFKMEW